MAVHVWERKGKTGSTFYLHFMGPDGKQVRKRLADITTREQAELAASDLRLRLARGGLGLPTNEGLTVAECYGDFVDSKRATCTDGHLGALDMYAREVLEYFGADMVVKGLTVLLGDGWRLALRRRGLGTEAINKRLTFLKGAVVHAVESGRLAANPVAKLQRESRKEGDVWRFLSEEEVGGVLAVLRDGRPDTVERSNGRRYQARLGRSLRAYWLTLAALHTGLRKSELFALKWADLDLARGTVRALTTKKAARGRSAKAQFIPINLPLRALLEGMGPGAADKPVFGRDGNWRRKLNRAAEQAGVEPFRIHDLRHTFASHLVAVGTPLFVVARLLGHSTTTMTERYSHLAPGADVLAVANLTFGPAEDVGARVVDVAEQAS